MDEPQPGSTTPAHDVEACHRASAFRDVYNANVGCVHGFLRARVGPRDAEDLTAETFCRAFAHFSSWEDRGIPIRAWLLRIAYNLIVGESRRARPFLLELHEEVGRTSALNTDTRTENRMEAQSALAVMNELPESHRTVIDLRYLRGLSVAETAAVLGLKEEAVRSLSYRALRGLRARHQNRWGFNDADDPGPAPETRMKRAS